MNREKALVKNTLIISLGTFLPRLTSTITLPIITAGLTKAEYGTYDLITTLVSLFLPIATLQIQSAAFRFLIDCRNDENQTQKTITNIMFFVVPITAIGVFVLYFALYRITWILRLCICIYYFLDIFVLLFQQIVRGLSFSKLYSLSAVIRSIINMAVVVVAVLWLQQGLFGVLLSLIISSFVSIVLLGVQGHIFGRIDPTLVSGASLKELIGYSWPMVPTQVSSWVLTASDRMVLTTFLGLEATAIYSVACKIPNLLTALQGTYAYAWQESASLSANDADNDEYYSSMFDNMCCILSGLLGLLIAVTPVLFVVLIRGDYGAAYKQMPVLFLAMLFSGLSTYLGGLYIAYKKTKSAGLTTVLAAIVNLLIDLILVKKIGIFAASVSTLVSYIALFLYRIIDIRKFLKVYFNLRKMLIQCLVLFVMCVLCWINTLASNVLNVIIACLFVVIYNKKFIRGAINIIKSKIER